MDFLSTVQRTIAAHGLLDDGDHVVVGVSGGRDSVALLRVLLLLAAPFRLTLTVAHVNYGLRGAASDEDERFVRDLAAQSGTPIEVLQAPLAPRQGVEAWARDVRYAFFSDVARRVGATRIAVGHTADDQAETVLLRFLRGSGPAGLAGMRARTGLVIRPLLDISRAEVTAFVASLGQSYRDDASNADPRFLRNRVRHELLPLLQQRYAPAITTQLQHHGILARETADALDWVADALLARAADGSGQYSFPATIWTNLPTGVQSSVLRHAVHIVGGPAATLRGRHLREALRVATLPVGGRQVTLAPGLTLTKRAGTVSLLFSPARA